MGGAVFPPYSLAWGQTKKGLMVTSFKRTYARLLCLVTLTPHKCPLPLFQQHREDSTHGHHQMVNTEIRLYSLQPKMEKLYTVSKNKTRSWLWLRLWTLYCQIQTEIEESGEKTRPFSSFQFSRSVVSDSLWPHESQHARPPCASPTPGVHSDSHPSSQWCPQPSHPLLSPSPPAPNPSQHQRLFQWVNSSHEVAKVLEFQL